MSDKTPRIDRIDKNYIINGGCEYFQVGGASTAVAVPSSFDYVSMDMFEMETSGTWTTPESSRSVSPVGSKTRRSHLFTGTPTTLSDEFRMRTKIESIFAADLAEKEFSLGLKLKSSNFTQVTITVSYADSEDVFAATTQIAQQTFTFNADSTEQEVVFENIATATNVRNGLQVQYDFKGLGALAATTLSVGEFVLNKGRKKSQYSPAARDQVEELSLCQRYYEKSVNVDIVPFSAGVYGGAMNINMSSVAVGATMGTTEFKVLKRATPTVTFWEPANGFSTQCGATGGAAQGTNSATPIYVDTRCASVYNTSAGALSSAPGFVTQWQADARL